MGLGKLLNRAVVYEATNTVTGATETFTIQTDNPLAPDWATDDYRGALGIPGAWRAATLISDMLGSVPWNAYRRIGDRPAEKLYPVPPLLDQPSPPETRMTTISSMALDLLMHGNAVSLIGARDAQGNPTVLHPVPANEVMVRRVTPGAYSTLPIGAIEYRVGPLDGLSSFDVVHVKGPCAPGELRGMGVLEVHMATLGLAHEQGKQAGGLAHHGVPSGLIKSSNPDLDQAEADGLKAAWMRAQSTRRPMVLNGTTDFEPLSWNPEQMQLVEARRLTREELALIFGVPGYFLGVEAGSMTYSNAEQQGTDLVRYTLGGHLARIEQELSQQFPRGTWVKANLDSYLRADTTTRYAAHATAIGSGFLTVDEVREIEDRPPLPDPEPLPQPPDTTAEDENESDDEETEDE